MLANSGREKLCVKQKCIIICFMLRNIFFHKNTVGENSPLWFLKEKRRSAKSDVSKVLFPDIGKITNQGIIVWATFLFCDFCFGRVNFWIITGCCKCRANIAQIFSTLHKKNPRLTLNKKTRCHSVIALGNRWIMGWIVGWQSLDNKKNNSNRFVLFLT